MWTDWPQTPGCIQSFIITLHASYIWPIHLIIMSPPSLVWRLPLLISIPWVQQVSSGTVSIRDRKRDVSSWRHFLYFVIPLGVVHSLRTRNFFGMNQLDRILGVFQQHLFVDPTFRARSHRTTLDSTLHPRQYSPHFSVELWLCTDWNSSLKSRETDL